MILFELTGTEAHLTYQKLAIANGNRQYDFLKSIVETSLEVGRPFLSQHVIKALNFQAITCLHTNAGEYRPCPVIVGSYEPPEHYRVGALMDDFVNMVNRNWESQDPVVLASFVLWRLNHIHPFINGNGRTARAACYFVLCLKLGALLPGERILPELLTENRARYVAALQEVDASLPNLNLEPLHTLLSELLNIQVADVVDAGDEQVADEA
ncbi:Fic family protein [Agrobacterium tumefaciens]|uniref:Fic family protein n=1 Tax=Agrobacterium tumefaciens TaxID=358 RepID=UPI001573AFAE|nr:Fic family protein [Agrobacterium tumefaciens]NTD84343.1 cell filamentation protein Fic [Agrobacterium tumefaciens]NTD94659.1 cell filamentation protein Fic [Agrobacterium tumefaciens]NTD96110.1 cell filamentation protein Fic [Agrobacterium tumefaciens]NTE13969.1 cell filamentation protein Fic [Agrobacterium tumefaciens]NTE19583.1 cell filamentation protein Fic [Agrobacterium tumefaciens]